MDTFNEIAARIAEFFLGSRRAPGRAPEFSHHLHWDRIVRAWSEDPGATYPGL